MEKIGQRIRRLRKVNNMTQDDLAHACGDIKKASVSAWELGKTKPTLDALLSLIKIFNLTLDELVLGHSSAAPAREPRGEVPLVSWVNAGAPSDAMDDVLCSLSADEWIPCAEPHSGQTYALRVEGHSMTAPMGRSYPEGRIIICDPEQSGGSHSGQRVIARILDTGHVTFKELVTEDGLSWLRSLNPHPQYQPITESFEVIALVISSHIPE